MVINPKADITAAKPFTSMVVNMATLMMTTVVDRMDIVLLMMMLVCVLNLRKINMAIMKSRTSRRGLRVVHAL